MKLVLWICQKFSKNRKSREIWYSRIHKLGTFKVHKIMLIKIMLNFQKLFRRNKCYCNFMPLKNEQFYIRNFKLITNMQITVKKSSPLLEILLHQIERDWCNWFSNLIFTWWAHPLRGDLILQPRELKLIFNGGLINFLLYTALYI